MAHEYRIFDASTDLESDEDKLARLSHEIKAYEHQHYLISQEESPDQDVLDEIESELTEKINQYEALGGTFD
tara:strand:+ start:116 stop:331 length:216 start_codon:yes stop_codon:yes gene_type:complete